LVLIAAVAILGIGAIMIISQLLQPSAPPRQTQVAVARQMIEPYTIITQDMLAASESVRQSDAESRGAWPVDTAVGIMTTDRIAPGQWVTTLNARPVKDVRFAEDLGLEVVTFQAGLDRTVGGELRPGHLVNVYGNGRSREGEPFTRLIEDQVWVVAVSAAGQPVTNETAVPGEDGELQIEGGDRNRGASLITVAVTPDEAFNIINSIGSEGLNPWVTLAASQTASGVMATPVPSPMPSATWGLPPDIAATATALANALASPVPRPPITGGGGNP
jgi:hypothetical protein